MALSRDLTLASSFGSAFAISPDGTQVAVRPDMAYPVPNAVIDVATGKTTTVFETDDVVSWQRLARSR